MGKLCLVRMLNLVKVLRSQRGRLAVLECREALSGEAVESFIGVEKSDEASLCNLERFIKAVTPLVPARYFPEVGFFAIYVQRHWIFQRLDLCNLERFIKAVTPSVPARCFPEYKPDEPVKLWVNKVGPYNNPQEIYNYYSLPFCHPSINPAHKWGGLGEVLGGNELIDNKFQSMGSIE